VSLTIYQSALRAYAKQQGVTIEQALQVAIEQSRGKSDEKGQIEQYKKACRELTEGHAKSHT